MSKVTERLKIEDLKSFFCSECLHKILNQIKTQTKEYDTRVYIEVERVYACRFDCMAVPA